MKKNLSLLLLFVISIIANSHVANSQSIAPAITWQKCIGGSGDDVASFVQPTPDGGFLIAGSSNSTDGDITNNYGQDDFYIVKLNDSGDLVWQHSYGSRGSDEAVGVALTTDGGYAIAGKSNSTGGEISGSHGSADFCLIKTDSEGNIQWQKSYGGSENDVAYSMVQTSDNGYIIGGVTYSTDGDVVGSHGLGDAWIIKVDENGNLQWQRCTGGSKFDVANDVKQTTDGGYFVTGYTISNNGDIAIHRGQEDFMFFKLDADGNLQWLKTMGGSGGDCGHSGIQTLDGGYAICGLTHSRDFDVTDHIAAHDLWVVKTNSVGEAEWTHCYGGTEGDDGFDIKQQNDGQIIICGYTGSNDHDVSGLHGLHDVWIAALEPSGNLLWQKTLGGSNYEYPHNLQILSDGQYVLAGRTKSSDGDVSGNHGNFDFWIVRLSSSCIRDYYADADEDGFGNLHLGIKACTMPSGYVTDSGDCDDENNLINPDAIEICNGLDDNCNGSMDENSIMVSTIPTGNVSLCSGLTLNISANYGDGISYQWYKGSKQIFGATNQTYSAKAAGTYTVNETNNNGCSARSAPVVVAIISAPPAVITPLGDLNLCLTGSVDLQANSGIGFLYQWMKGNIIISGATNQVYTIAAKGNYKAIVTNADGCSKTSNALAVVNSCRESDTNTNLPTEFRCYPNPSNGEFTVELRLNEATSQLAVIDVFNNINQKIYSSEELLNDGVLQTSIAIDNFLPDGLYLVRITVGDLNLSNQVMIQH